MNCVRLFYGFVMAFLVIFTLHPALASLSDDDQIIATIIKDIKKHPLDNHLWEKIIKHPSYDLLRDPSPQVFASLGLHAVLNQTQTLIRDSFLQHNLANVREANVLWKSFFVIYDDLKQRELGVDGHQSESHKESQQLPRAIRALKVAKKFEREKSISESANHSKEVEAAQNLQLDILSTGGTFGINFNRRVNAVEAGSIVKSLRALGENIAAPKVQPVNDLLHEFTIKLGNMNQSDVNQAVSGFIKSHNSKFKGVITNKNMLDSLYRYMLRPVLLGAAHEIASRLFKSLSNLSHDQQAMLLNHQTNCAVVALYHVFSAHTLDAFSEIDEVLASRLGGRKSEERYNEVMAMVGYSPSEGDRHISKEEIDGILNLDDEVLKVDAVE